MDHVISLAMFNNQRVTCFNIHISRFQSFINFLSITWGCHKPMHYITPKFGQVTHSLSFTIPLMWHLADPAANNGHICLKWSTRQYHGSLNVPFWVYWTSPEKVAMALTIYLMVGWCSMGTFNDLWICVNNQLWRFHKKKRWDPNLQISSNINVQSENQNRCLRKSRRYPTCRTTILMSVHNSICKSWNVDVDFVPGMLGNVGSCPRPQLLVFCVQGKIP